MIVSRDSQETAVRGRSPSRLPSLRTPQARSTPMPLAVPKAEYPSKPDFPNHCELLCPTDAADRQFLVEARA